MSVKKLLVLSAAAFAAMGATAAMAGGPDHMAMPSEPAFQNSVYLEGHLGYAQSNWADNNTSKLMGRAAVSSFLPTNNGKGGLTAGLDLGYNITQHIAVEGGWFYLPKVSGHGSNVSVGGVTETSATTLAIKSWLAYVAAKLSVPVMDHLNLFGKIGVGYRSLKNSFGGTTVNAALPALGTSGHYWAPVFGAGVQYDWNNWLVGAQYLYVPGNDAVNYGNANFGAPDSAPEAHLYTGSIGYKFNV